MYGVSFQAGKYLTHACDESHQILARYRIVGRGVSQQQGFSVASESPASIFPELARMRPHFPGERRAS